MLNTSSLRLAVFTSETTQLAAATLLAKQLSLPLITTLPDNMAAHYDYLLIFTSHYLGLHKTTEKKQSPFYIDFLSQSLLYRRKEASLRNELLARAMGVSPNKNPTIIDATAGLGRDSFILASLGFKLTLLERSPVIYALLQNALERAQADPQLSTLIQRMQLIHADANDWLTDKQADIVYIDPMFPERKKSAAVKKEMVILQQFLGVDDQTDTLLAKALTCATYRVVVKRPRLADVLKGQKPNFSLSGKTSRFDVYLGMNYR
jgi:16S rRNA (guanine1516-N2)-methyltransferase